VLTLFWLKEKLVIRKELSAVGIPSFLFLLFRGQDLRSDHGIRGTETEQNEKKQYHTSRANA
jgi:hypothetical protein